MGVSSFGRGVGWDVGGQGLGGGGRGCSGFLALDLTALLALWAAGGLAAPADFHRTHKKSHWSFKALKIFLVSLDYVFLWTLPFVPLSAAAACAHGCEAECECGQSRPQSQAL